MTKLLCIITVLIISVLSLASCAPVNTENNNTDIVPTTTISANPNTIADSNTAFAFDLYRQLKTQDGNLFLSPYSISAALAMTAAGAKENTLWQMTSSLHYTPVGEELHKLISQLDNELKSRSQDVKIYASSNGGDTKEVEIDGFTLNIINALWGQKDYHFQKEYLNLIEQYYGGELNDVDFINEPEKALQLINDWANEQTKGRIKDLLSSGDIDTMTRLILTNAIYFKAQWQIPFSEKATAPASFYLLDNNTVSVPMMHEQEQFNYTEGDNYQAAGLPYLGGELDMIILLPDKGKFQEFEDSLDMTKLKSILAKMERKEVKMSLPKFGFTSEFKLKQTLTALGMTDAFDHEAADFSGITGDKSLYIDEVIHKSFVAVDEKGTEAAAVTAVIMKQVSLPRDVEDFNADRPFIFIIRDIQTGTILFMGRVLNPAA